MNDVGEFVVGLIVAIGLAVSSIAVVAWCVS